MTNAAAGKSSFAPLSVVGFVLKVVNSMAVCERTTPRFESVSASVLDISTFCPSLSTAARLWSNVGAYSGLGLGSSFASPSPLAVVGAVCPAAFSASGTATGATLAGPAEASMLKRRLG
eukprot:CAMPEP_0180764660 /NCGR_PEP_ID=MMETSP1038_2-20121128/38572_1 /TAXON_ID=632150 /ORGANISM="Azadinium spinosum, Strain 3D9" /LENGTH=118 /DNA_ID=CAMNT_0022799103 /DNA_START=234 /DNA_END=588 /DNA_ORIENTATION=+